MDELLKDFLVETGEHIEAVTAQLVRFERDPGDTRIIANIYRLVHSIKGTCGFLDLPRLEAVAHAAETLIGRLRDGAPPTPDAVNLVLRAVDRVKQIVAGIEKGGSEPAGDDSKLIAELVSRASGVKLRQPDNEAWDVADPAESGEAPAPTPSAPAALLPERRSETVRVSVGTLERLMALVSELVLARNQLVDRARHVSGEDLDQPLQRLSSVTTDLQHGVMKARMQPIGRLFSSLPRVVRDLAAELDKRIDVVTSGADTELDRQLIAVVRDPLTHLIRNAVSHGIERPHERRAAGKPEIGLIDVRAYQDAGAIVIEVSDDGRGVDVAAIRVKAAARGLAREAEIACMTDAEVARFIFAPGFTTAQSVTNISGRGVGLDVVRENVEAIGGSVALASTSGKGARFVLKIPLTLAIAPALIVSSGGERFALPRDGVLEAHELDENRARLEVTQGAPVVMCGRGVLPARDLRDILRIGPPEAERAPATHAVLLRIGATTFAVLVDDIVEVLEIVVKPLPPKIGRIGMYSGVTLMGDGSALLILDASGLARAIGVGKADAFRLEAPAAEDDAAPAPIVLFRTLDGRSMATPAATVARIEKLTRQELRLDGGVAAARVAGRITPILEAAASAWPQSEPGQPIPFKPLLVFGEGADVVGLVVDEIVDVIEARLDIETASDRPGALGAATIKGRIVEVCDVGWFMERGRGRAPRAMSSAGAVLLVDDSAFFRELLSGALRAAGYAVVTAADADAAAAALADPDAICAIALDGDLGGEDGYVFARVLRDALEGKAPPIVGLDAHATPLARRRAQEAGMAAVVGKFDRAGLVAAVAAAMAGASAAGASRPAPARAGEGEAA